MRPTTIQVIRAPGSRAIAANLVMASSQVLQARCRSSDVKGAAPAHHPSSQTAPMPYLPGITRMLLGTGRCPLAAPEGSAPVPVSQEGQHREHEEDHEEDLRPCPGQACHSAEAEEGS